MDTALDRLKQILKREIGLDATTVGDATIRKILNQRMHSCQIRSVEHYYQLLAGNPDELQALLETAVIPETWFFRDSKPFELIRQSIQNRLLTHPGETCNILSIPCSTGEEPYSIAMYLLAHDIPCASFAIHACDVSTQALSMAREACYTQNSFRGKTEQKYLDRFFLCQHKTYSLREEVKQQISFGRMNILDGQNIPFNQYFDFILCRNLLIYFDTRGKQTAFTHLHKMLKNDGMLFIGHSEYGAVPQALFHTTRHNDVFGLIQQAHWQQQQARTQTKTHNTAVQQPDIAQRAFESFPVRAKDAHESATTDTDDKDLLEQARILADQGQLAQAEQLCLQHIERHGDSSASFYLLGLIHAAGNHASSAEIMFRKVIYLEPRHYEALVHLALLLEQSGDMKAAQLFRQRAERALAG